MMERDEEKIKVEFTISEIQLLGRLINFAVQARGLEVAEASVFFAKKLADAASFKAREGGNGSIFDVPMPPTDETATKKERRG